MVRINPQNSTKLPTKRPCKQSREIHRRASADLQGASFILSADDLVAVSIRFRKKISILVLNFSLGGSRIVGAKYGWLNQMMSEVFSVRPVQHGGRERPAEGDTWVYYIMAREV